MKELTILSPKFKEKIILKTIAKQDQIIESLHSIYIFIKDYYLEAEKGIDDSFASFYNRYSGRRDKPASKIAISKLLATDLNIKVFYKRIGQRTCRWLNISFEDLYIIYKKNG